RDAVDSRACGALGTLPVLLRLAQFQSDATVVDGDPAVDLPRRGRTGGGGGWCGTDGQRDEGAARALAVAFSAGRRLPSAGAEQIPATAHAPRNARRRSSRDRGR